LSRREQLVRYF